MGKTVIGAGIALDGEADFRKAVTGINTDIKVLGSEMKKVTSEFIGNEKSIESLTAKEQVLNKQLDTQKDKIKAVREALENSQKQYGENSDKTKKWQVTLNEAESDLNKLNNEVKENKIAMERAQNPTTELAADVKNLGNSADNSADKLHAFQTKLNDGATKALKGFAVGIAAVTAALGTMLKKSLDNADSIAQTAEIYGMTAERVQELTYVGTKLDVELETITKSQQLLTKSMYAAKDGTGEQAKVFKQLGIAVVDGNGKLRDSKTVMGEAIDALSKMTNETERDAYAQKVFGKSAMELNPLINAGSKGIADLTDEAHSLGMVLSNEAIGDLDKTGDNLETLNQKLQVAFGELSIKLLPEIDKLIDYLQKTDFTPLINGFQWVIDHAQGILTGVGLIGGSLLGIKVTLEIIEISNAFHALSASMVAANVTGMTLAGTITSIASMLGVLAAAAGVLYLITDNANKAKAAIEGLNRQTELNAQFEQKTLPVIASMTPEQKEQYAKSYSQLQKSVGTSAGIPDTSFFTDWWSGVKSIMGFADGVTNFKGGLAMINERGGELVNLPNGTNIIPHDISMEIARNTEFLSGSQTRKIVHSGTLIVKGVNNQGETVGVAEIIMDKLKMDSMLAGAW